MIASQGGMVKVSNAGKRRRVHPEVRDKGEGGGRMKEEGDDQKERGQGRDKERVRTI